MNRLTVQEAYEKWADELVAYATAVAGREAAADVVADTFASILRSERAAVGAQRASAWQGVREPRAYLYRTVLNTARSRHRTLSRRAAREARHEATWGAILESSTLATDSPLHDPAVAEAVRSLSPNQRAAIYLTYWEDLPIADVAQHLGCSTGAVKRQLARARASLRTALRREEQ